MQHDCQAEESDVSGKQPHQHLTPESQSLSSDSTSAQKNLKMNMSNQFLGSKIKLRWVPQKNTSEEGTIKCFGPAGKLGSTKMAERQVALEAGGTSHSTRAEAGGTRGRWHQPFHQSNTV